MKTYKEFLIIEKFEKFEESDNFISTLELVLSSKTITKKSANIIRNGWNMMCLTEENSKFNPFCRLVIPNNFETLINYQKSKNLLKPRNCFDNAIIGHTEEPELKIYGGICLLITRDLIYDYKWLMRSKDNKYDTISSSNGFLHGFNVKNEIVYDNTLIGNDLKIFFGTDYTDNNFKLNDGDKLSKMIIKDFKNVN